MTWSSRIRSGATDAPPRHRRKGAASRNDSTATIRSHPKLFKMQTTQAHAHLLANLGGLLIALLAGNLAHGQSTSTPPSTNATPATVSLAITHGALPAGAFGNRHHPLLGHHTPKRFLGRVPSRVGIPMAHQPPGAPWPGRCRHHPSQCALDRSATGNALPLSGGFTGDSRFSSSTGSPTAPPWPAASISSRRSTHARRPPPLSC